MTPERLETYAVADVGLENIFENSKQKLEISCNTVKRRATCNLLVINPMQECYEVLENKLIKELNLKDFSKMFTFCF